MSSKIDLYVATQQEQSKPPESAPLVSVPNDVPPKFADTDFFAGGIVGDVGGPSAETTQAMQKEVGSALQNADTLLDTQLTYLYGQLNSPFTSPEQAKVYQDRIDELKALQVKLGNAKLASETADLTKNQQIFNDILPELSDTLGKDWSQNVAGISTESQMFGDAVNRYVFLKSIFAPDQYFNGNPGMQMLYTIVSGDRRGQYDFNKLPFLMDSTALNRYGIEAGVASGLTGKEMGKFKWDQMTEQQKSDFYQQVVTQRTFGNVVQGEGTANILDAFLALSTIVQKPPSLWSTEDQKLFAAFQDAYVVENDYKHYLVTRDDPQWNTWDAKLFKEQIDRKGNGYYEPKVWEQALGWTIGGLGLIFSAFTPMMPVTAGLMGSAAFVAAGFIFPPVGGPDWLHKLYLGLSLGIGGAQLLSTGFKIAEIVKNANSSAAAVGVASEIVDQARTISGVSTDTLQTATQAMAAGADDALNAAVDTIDVFYDAEQGAQALWDSLGQQTMTAQQPSLYSRLSSNVSQAASRAFNALPASAQQVVNATSEFAARMSQTVADVLAEGIANPGLLDDFIQEEAIAPVISEVMSAEDIATLPVVERTQTILRALRDTGAGEIGLQEGSRGRNIYNWITEKIISGAVSPASVQKISDIATKLAEKITNPIQREIGKALAQSIKDTQKAPEIIGTAVSSIVTNQLPSVSAVSSPLGRQITAVLRGNAVSVKTLAKETVSELVKSLQADKLKLGKTAVMFAGQLGYGAYKTVKGNEAINQDSAEKLQNHIYDVVGLLDKVGASLGYSITDAVKDSIFEELAVELLNQGKMDRFDSKVDLDTFRQVAALSYEQEPSGKQIQNYSLEYNGDTVKAWVDEESKRVMLSMRGTNAKDLRDMAASLQVPVNRLSSSARYLHDKAQIDKILREYDPSEYSFYLTGHSLGGAIATQLKREYPFFKEAVTFNGANQPLDLLIQNSRGTKRMYTETDPLYSYGAGSLLQSTVAEPRKKQKVSGTQTPLKALLSMYKGHQLANFKDQRGTAGYNY